MSEQATAADRTTVWLCITALCIGGAERTLVDLANGLETDRYSVTVWTIFDTTPLASELQPNITVRSLTSAGRVENDTVVGATTPLAYLVVPIKFCYVAAVERPDIIHSFLFFDNLLARFGGLVSSATVITGVRAVPTDPSPIRRRLDSVTIRLSDHIVSNSEAGKTLAISRGAAADRVSVIPNGRPLSPFEQAESKAVKTELGIESELVVGTVGRLLERKGYFELLTAWSELSYDGEARLVFVGDGADRQAIEQHAETLGCAASVEFLGTRRDVPELLAAMDVFVLPSHFEGLPGAVIEAMAAGLPIVATPVDGTAELLDNYRTGLFVPPEDPAELRWALSRLIETPALRESLGEAAQMEATQRFDVETMVGSFDQLYQQVA